MNRGIQRGLGLPTLMGVETRLAMPQRGVTLPNTDAATRWRPHNRTGGNLVLVQNTLYAAKCYIEPGYTLVGLGVVSIGVASTSVRFGVYADDSTVVDGPGSLIFDTGVETGTTGGFATCALSISDAEGWVWLALAVHGGAGNLGCALASITADSIIHGVTAPYSTGLSAGFSQTGITGALPNPWGTTMTETARVPNFYTDLRPF